MLKYGVMCYSISELVEMGVALEMRKYVSCGHYSPWRVVDGVRALHKASISVDGFCPYEFRIAE